MFCRKCGKAVAQGEFCAACGSTFTTNGSPALVEDCSQATLSESLAKPRLWVILFGVLLCLTCVGLIVGIPLIITETKSLPVGIPRRNIGWLVASGVFSILFLISIIIVVIGISRTPSVINNQIPLDARDGARLASGSYVGPVKPYIPDRYLNTIGYNYEQVLKCLGKPSDVVDPDVGGIVFGVVPHRNYKCWSYSLPMAPAPGGIGYNLLFNRQTKRVYQVETTLVLVSVKPMDFLPEYLITQEPDAIYCDCYTAPLSVVWRRNGIMYLIEVQEDGEALQSTLQEIDSQTGDAKVTHPLNGDAWKRGRLVSFVASSHDISGEIKSRRIRLK